MCNGFLIILFCFSRADVERNVRPFPKYAFVIDIDWVCVFALVCECTDFDWQRWINISFLGLYNRVSYTILFYFFQFLFWCVSDLNVCYLQLFTFLVWYCMRVLFDTIIISLVAQFEWSEFCNATHFRATNSNIIISVCVRTM